MQLRRNVVLVRNLVDISYFYKAIDLLVVPTVLPESYPRFIQEALYLRIPIVASAIGDLPDLINNCGIIINSQYPSKWRAAFNEAVKINLPILNAGRRRIIAFQKENKINMVHFFNNLIKSKNVE